MDLHLHLSVTFLHTHYCTLYFKQIRSILLPTYSMTARPSKKKLSLSKSTKARDETSPSAKWKLIKKGLSKTKSCSRRNKGRYESTKAHSSPQLQALQGALDCPGCEYAQNVSNSMMLI